MSVCGTSAGRMGQCDVNFGDGPGPFLVLSAEVGHRQHVDSHVDAGARAPASRSYPSLGQLRATIAVPQVSEDASCCGI